jgi:L-ascorbate metabolism protein UlaG (beta-lactamase superfamily)
MILSHDHYDHLDYKSIVRLKSKVKKYYVALGVARHLIEWGVPPDDITEFDWWETTIFEEIQITFTPSRHFSGRGLKDRFKGLWGGWVFKSSNENIWFSGDGGRGKHFKEIGEKLGPFDFAFMECGQYNILWPLIHLFPEESVQSALSAKALKIMPVHWGSFTLSDHKWNDPVKRFVSESQQNSIPYLTPKIGESITPHDHSESPHWWEVID